ncbi:MAG: acyl-CoA thioesterase [Rhodospirillales bacterium]|nr:acyl-CoA thioesterase [Rhodospirillales bacterium]MDH3790182.1 acyl-CoA thioesterase [Rhodospirillales bacterium]MDH3909783.1 acyl-CoA thioesterase [Rhodospirillales bacterium]MDH3920467.1 acyl-CoA thioesterase [Rhodospirillales bacterium]
MGKETGGSAKPSAFNVTRRVKWGDCDPAGIIYTPRVLDYAMETLEAWNREVLGVPWMKLNWEMSMGWPTVRAELDFLAAPAPDEDVVTELRVEQVGRSSITFLITGDDGNGRAFFRVKVTSCLISRPAFKPTPIPKSLLERIHDYRKVCGEA